MLFRSTPDMNKKILFKKKFYLEIREFGSLKPYHSLHQQGLI